jgi:hypothetical protein
LKSRWGWGRVLSSRRLSFAASKRRHVITGPIPNPEPLSL